MEPRGTLAQPPNTTEAVKTGINHLLTANLSYSNQPFTQSITESTGA